MVYRVSSFVDGLWEHFNVDTETQARAEALNQNGSILADLERDGYHIRRLQAVLDHDDGSTALVEVEPTNGG